VTCVGQRSRGVGRRCKLNFTTNDMVVFESDIPSGFIVIWDEEEL
jgi:hypothetical protein